VSDMQLIFTTPHYMSNQEIVYLHLPGFNGPTNSRFFINSVPVYCGPESNIFGCTPKYRTASWDDSTKVLALSLFSSIEVFEEETVKIIIPSQQSQIALPPEGVVQNQVTLSIRNDGLVGPFPWTAISNVDSVTVFDIRPQLLQCDLERHCPFPLSPTTSELVRPIISFGTPKAKTGTSATVSFSTKRDFVTGDTIDLRLSGFYPSSNTPMTVDTIYKSGNLTGSWVAALPGLKLTVEGDLPRKLDFVLSEAQGLVMSALGNRMNEAGHVFTLVQGDDYGSVVCISPAVGTLLDTVIKYDACADQSPSNDDSCECTPLSPWSAALISFSFKTVMRLQPGDTISLFLPGFSYAENRNLKGAAVTSDPAGVFSHADWDHNATQLTVVVSNRIDPGTMKFELPISAGLRLPPNGTLQNDAYMQFHANISEGMILSTSIESSQAVPTIPADSSLGFEPSIPNQYMDVVFMFNIIAPRRANSPTCMSGTGVFYPGDSIIVKLPTFRADVDDESLDPKSRRDFLLDPFGQNKSAVVMETTTVPPDLMEDAVWFDHLKMLVFPVAQRLGAQNFILITISRKAGLTSTANVERNSPTHTIAAMLDGSYIPPTAILRSTLIRDYGSVTLSDISFDPPSTLLQPNPKKVRMNIRFALDLDLEVGDFVDLLLPGFTSAIDFDGYERQFLVSSEPLTVYIPCWHFCSVK
jgi:hypothetical protein